MKELFLVLSLSVILLAHPSIDLKSTSFKTDFKIIEHNFIEQIIPAGRVGTDKCKTCIDFARNSLHELLNITVESGVIASCSALCGALANKTSKATGEVCDRLCDIVGIEEFIQIVKKSGDDPFYYCELIPECPINDHGDASFTSFTVTPECQVQGQSIYHPLTQAGDHTGEIKLNAKPDPNCNSSKGPCEKWLPGDYNLILGICNGQCESKHLHSAVYDYAVALFTIWKF